MTTRQITITVVDGPSQAPIYGAETPLLLMKSAIIVGNGTQAGKPSVDIKLVDDRGNEYVVMATGGIIEMLAGAIRGKREKDEEARQTK